jgi:hypothetical protein
MKLIETAFPWAFPSFNGRTGGMNLNESENKETQHEEEGFKLFSNYNEI